MIIYWTQNPKISKDWLRDGFKWKNQGGRKPLPQDSPLVLKSYYHIIDKTGKITNDFVKNVYILYGSESELPVLIQYSMLEPLL